MLEKCIDGEVFGRLSLCPLCARRLKLQEGGYLVLCIGNWDADQLRRVRCNYDSLPSFAPRFNQWYVQIGWVYFMKYSRETWLILHLLYFIHLRTI
jgi:hypothetical protein